MYYPLEFAEYVAIREVFKLFNRSNINRGYGNYKRFWWVIKEEA